MKTIEINGKEIPVYCTVEDADSYFAEKYTPTVWNDATELDKKQALVQAARQLNSLRLKGFPSESGQPLLFPRLFKINYLSKRTMTAEAHNVTLHGNRDLIYLEECFDFTMANAEQAAFIMETANNVHLKNQELGIQSINIGAGTVSYNGYNQQVLCASAMNLVDKYIIKTARVV